MPSFRVSTKIKMDTKGLTKLGRRLNKQKSMVVEVGHFGGKQHLDSEDTIASISLINQQGNRKIPARPYMLMAISSAAFVKEYNKSLKLITEGNSSIAVELPKLGQVLKEVTIGVLEVGGPGFPPNSPATIAAKEGDRPLIDTGTMVSDIRSRLVRDSGRKKQKGLNKVAV